MKYFKGFIICWMPFFVVYLLEVFINNNVSASATFKLLNELFLWLGYLNSVCLNLFFYIYQLLLFNVKIFFLIII